MDGLSVLYAPLTPEELSSHPAYIAGNALGWLSRGNKQAATNAPLAGRLYVAKSGWLLLSVPNALVRGVYDAMVAPGAELPLAGIMNVPNVESDVLNAHISVMTAAEVEKIGPDNIHERGHMFGYSLGRLEEITPRNIDGISKLWAVQVSSPELTALRKSYGLSPTINDHPFHITVAVRKKHVLRDNPVSKAAGDIVKLSRAVNNDILPGGKADNLPDREFSSSALSEGAAHEHEHTDNDQIAKEIAEDHLHEDPTYYKKVEIIEDTPLPEIVKRVTKKAGSVYANQARNALNFRRPIVYDHNKPLFENIGNQLSEMKRRGDFVMQTRRNHEMYLSALDPKYRYQRMMQAFHGQLPQENVGDQIIERYGDAMLSNLTGGRR